MQHTDTSEILRRGMKAALDAWGPKLNGSPRTLYWVLKLHMAHLDLADGAAVSGVRDQVPDELGDEVEALFKASLNYWDDIRYASLEPVTQLWGTIVNGLRVVANSDRATAGQKRVFAYPVDSFVGFFRACRGRMEVADELYHVYRAMPAPECQALAALLNVHVDAPLDADTMCRLVRLLDHEGPMSDEEHQDLASLSNTHLVDAAFRGLRANA